MIGFGSKNFSIAIHIANRPELDEYRNLKVLKALTPHEIDQIVLKTGNHWRKIFNVSAKFIFQIHAQGQDSWQAYRDQILFQEKSPIALLFSAPPPAETQAPDVIHIVAGRTYAKELGLEGLLWLDDQFAISETQSLIVCPYLDYRQLSNARIETLVSLVQKLQKNNHSALS